MQNDPSEFEKRPDLSSLSREQLEAIALHLFECKIVIVENDNDIFRTLRALHGLTNQQAAALKEWYSRLRQIVEDSDAETDRLAGIRIGQPLN
jgi:hypothetical protein